MAKLGTSVPFDPTQHDTEQRGEYENLPDGDYRLEVEMADVKIDGGDDPRTRKVGVKVTYKVLEPEDYKDRKVFDYFNLENPSSDAQRIGQAQFAALCRSMSIDKPVGDTDELMFIAFTAKIGMGKDSKSKKSDGSPEYPARNEIKKFYFPDEGNVPAPNAKPRPPRAGNDNRPAANDNSTARQTQNGGSAPTEPAKARPWGKK